MRCARSARSYYGGQTRIAVVVVAHDAGGCAAVAPRQGEGEDSEQEEAGWNERRGWGVGRRQVGEWRRVSCFQGRRAGGNGTAAGEVLLLLAAGGARGKGGLGLRQEGAARFIERRGSGDVDIRPNFAGGRAPRGRERQGSVGGACRP
jgi:hypothetical protein